jgi:HAE1 family hydrophobic/amphiphilic exporter-1
MINKLLNRPTSVIVATLAVAALGVFSLLKLPLALLPAIERPSLTIVAKAAASSRDELVHDVTAPIERRLASVPGITAITSETRDGEARIHVESAWQTDADRLRIDVARRIEGAAATAPDELSVETSTDVTPVIEVAVTGATGATRTRVAQRILLPELARIEGAGRIDILGATPLRVTVRPRSSDLAARTLTAADVEERLLAAGRSLPAGRVREGAAVRPLVVAEPLRSLDAVKQLTIGSVPLAEVADVTLAEVPDDTAFVMTTSGERRAASGEDRGMGGGEQRTTNNEQRANATDSLLVRVYRAPNANAVALARAVRARVADLGGRLHDAQLRVVTDRSEEVTHALGELAFAAIAGILLATLVLRWMIGHWRPTLALAVVIPAALLATFTVFFAAGIPLDVISLAGLALATGLLVDNSIVVLEAIDSAGDVVRGTRQIVVAVVASSLTLMIVFAPLLYLRGLARAIFGEQALAVVASVGASLLLSLTLTPVLSAWRPAAAPGDAAKRRRDAGQRTYLALLDRALAAPRRALTLGAVATLAALTLVLVLPRELFSRAATTHLAVELPLPPDIEPAAARLRMHALAPALGDATVTRSGADTPLLADVAADATHTLQSLARQLPAARVRPRPSAFIEAAGGDASRVELIASATTDADAERLAQRVITSMQQHGFALEPDPARTRRAAFVLQWDERLLAENHADRAAVERDVRAALGDLDAGKAEVPGAEPEIRLLPSTPPNLTLAPVRLDKKVVPLAAVAAARLGERTPLAVRDEGRPAQRLAFRGTGEVPEFALHAGERLRIAGHARELRDAFAQLRLAFVLAVILLYLTVAAFYESLLLPLLVLAALPFAAGGALAALAVTGQSLNVMSLIGLIFLGGVVVNHTVVLLDRAEQLRAEGIDEDEAVRRAARDRYRPVIMTTVTAILAMLPLALAGGAGVELRRGIAIVVLGGLATATMGTLVLIPLLHRAVEPLRRRRETLRA